LVKLIKIATTAIEKETIQLLKKQSWLLTYVYTVHMLRRHLGTEHTALCRSCMHPSSSDHLCKCSTEDSMLSSNTIHTHLTTWQSVDCGMRNIHVDRVYECRPKPLCPHHVTTLQYTDLLKLLIQHFTQDFRFPATVL